MDLGINLCDGTLDGDILVYDPFFSPYLSTAGKSEHVSMPGDGEGRGSARWHWGYFTGKPFS